MAPFKTLLALASLCGASAFAPVAPKSQVVRSTALPVFEEAVSEWEAEYPDFAKFGWGPSVHAEVWNGRHAMFGWVFMCATAYAKGHGLMPTLCPNEFSDPLLLDPNAPGYDRAMERNSKPYGILPAFEWGLTPEAEIYNGRMAMMGIITVVTYSFITNTPILDVI